jgi:transposase
VAYHYIGGMRDQQFLLPTSMRDWLAEGHLAWFIIEVVERIDTTRLHLRHPNDGPGRPAYDPDMMLTLLLYAYVTGQRSSRRIEAAYRTDAAYRVICGDVVPDHATIARSLVNHEHAIEDVFVAVLRLCAAAGLVSVGTVAIDGTKIGSDAALDRNRSAEWIRREVATILSRARETDACENDQPGLLAVDQLPEQLSSATGRLAHLEEALALIEARTPRRPPTPKLVPPTPAMRPPRAESCGAANPKIRMRHSLALRRTRPRCTSMPDVRRSAMPVTRSSPKRSRPTRKSRRQPKRPRRLASRHRRRHRQPEPTSPTRSRGS